MWFGEMRVESVVVVVVEEILLPSPHVLINLINTKKNHQELWNYREGLQQKLYNILEAK